MNKLKYIPLLVILLFIASCSNSITDINSYLKYLSDKENGLVIEKATGGILMRVKYLPTDYLVFNDLKNKENNTPTLKDSIKQSYQNSITFMLTIGPDRNESFDITKVGVKDYEEFAQRIEEMNFNMAQYVTLKINEKEYAPALTQMESVNGLEQDRNILFVFNALDEQGKEILKSDAQLIYNDELFYTGINKFKFKMDKINNVPEFKF